MRTIPSPLPGRGDRVILFPRVSLVATILRPVGAKAMRRWLFNIVAGASLVLCVAFGGLRSEERRVGKECRSRGWPEHETEQGRGGMGRGKTAENGEETRRIRGW